MPLNFVALDFETANGSRASACAIGLVKVEYGVVTGTMSRLFRPPIGFDEFSGWNIAIHGITPAMVAKEKRFVEVWPDISRFIGDLPILAHNAAFDLSVLRSTLTASQLDWPEYSYGCTMEMSRGLFDLTSHSLSFVTHKAGIVWDESKHHDALYDAEICAEIAIAMSKLKDQTDLQALADALGLTLGQIYSDGYQSCRSSRYRGAPGHTRIKSSAHEIEVNYAADSNHPLYGKHIVFTGALHSMSRNDAWIEVAKVGGIPIENVTKATNVIVVGQQDISKLKEGATNSEKYQRAEALKAKGYDIEVMLERDFLAYIEPMQGIRESALPVDLNL